MKVVINCCYGGFSLSQKARIKYLDKKNVEYFFYKMDDGHKFNKFHKIAEQEYLNGKGWFEYITLEDAGENPGEIDMSEKYWWDTDLKRNDPILVEVVEEMGDEANGSCAKLRVVDIPDDVNWDINEYDGMERVEERHRSWD